MPRKLFVAMGKELYEIVKSKMTAEERAIEEKNKIEFSNCWIHGKVIDTKANKQ